MCSFKFDCYYFVTHSGTQTAEIEEHATIALIHSGVLILWVGLEVRSGYPLIAFEPSWLVCTRCILNWLKLATHP